MSRALVTRARRDAPRLVAALEAVGIDCAVVPLLERVPHAEAVRAALWACPAPDLLLLTSPFLPPLLARVATPAFRPKRVVAVGGRTQAEALAVGLPAEVVPDARTAAEVVAALGSLVGAVVLYPQAADATPDTLDALDRAGATRVDVVAYTNREPPGASLALAEAWPFDIAPLLSSSAASRLAAALDRTGLPASDLPVVAIGPSTAATARAAGLYLVATSDAPTVASLAAACASITEAR